MASTLSSLFNFLSSLLPSRLAPNPLHFPSPTSVNLSNPKTASGYGQLVATSGAASPRTCLPSSTAANVDDITLVAYPSLAYANTLFYKSGYYNVQVVVAENEPEEKLLSRFRRTVLKAGVIQECKRRRFFESSQDKKKRKAREAAKRNRKRRPQPKATTQAKQEPPKKDDDEDDNWELPEGELPY